MKAVYQTKYGKSDVLQFGDQPTPELKPHQVRVANHATSVNPRDWMIRGGRYQLQFLVPSFPLVLGSDLAGEVIEVGKSVHNFKVGDRVFGMKNPTEGLATYAEQVAVSESNIAHIPEGLSFLDAASVPLCGLTAWQALVDKAHVQTGNKVLIIGASGGVGSFAVQIAKALGAEVTAVCSGDNTKLAEALGASKTIDYQQQDVLMGSDTYDVVFDTIGRHSFAKCDKVLNAGGRYVSTIPSPKNLKAMVLTQLKVKLLRSTKTCSVVMVKSNGKDLTQLAELLASNSLSSHSLTANQSDAKPMDNNLANDRTIRPLIDSVFPLNEAAKAHDLSRSLRAKGKIILKIR